MNINFPPVDERYIKSKIESGYYSNATELVRDAVRRLREKDGASGNTRLLAALRKGDEDIEAGRVVPYSEKMMKDIRNEARKRVASGKPMHFDPDVVGPEAWTEQ